MNAQELIEYWDSRKREEARQRLGVRLQELAKATALLKARTEALTRHLDRHYVEATRPAPFEAMLTAVSASGRVAGPASGAAPTK